MSFRRLFGVILTACSVRRNVCIGYRLLVGRHVVGERGLLHGNARATATGLVSARLRAADRCRTARAWPNGVQPGRRIQRRPCRKSRIASALLLGIGDASGPCPPVWFALAVEAERTRRATAMTLVKFLPAGAVLGGCGYHRDLEARAAGLAFGFLACTYGFVVEAFDRLTPMVGLWSGVVGVSRVGGNGRLSSAVGSNLLAGRRTRGTGDGRLILDGLHVFAATLWVVVLPCGTGTVEGNAALDTHDIDVFVRVSAVADVFDANSSLGGNPKLEGFPVGA
jgi:hypothetical protein